MAVLRNLMSGLRFPVQATLPTGLIGTNNLYCPAAGFDRQFAATGNMNVAGTPHLLDADYSVPVRIYRVFISMAILGGGSTPVVNLEWASGELIYKFLSADVSLAGIKIFDFSPYGITGAASDGYIRLNYVSGTFSIDYSCLSLFSA